MNDLENSSSSAYNKSSTQLQNKSFGVVNKAKQHSSKACKTVIFLFLNM